MKRYLNYFENLFAKKSCVQNSNGLNSTQTQSTKGDEDESFTSGK